MSDSEKKSRIVRTPVGHLAYVTLVEPRKRNAKSDPRFSVTQVFPAGTQLTELVNACKEVAAKECKGNIPANFRWPFRKGEERRREDGTFPTGFSSTDIFIEAWKYEKHCQDGIIKCFDASRNPMSQRDLYSGVFAVLAVKPFFYDVDGNKGIALSLEGIQKVRDGEHIGGSEPLDPEVVFEVLEEESADALLGLVDDEIPF